MNVGKDQYAVRKALELLDSWNDVTGVVDKFSGYYWELCGIIKDAVHVGAMVALDVDFKIVDGEIVTLPKD